LTKKLPSLKAAYWAWLCLYMSSAAYNLITGRYQSTISRLAAQAATSLPGLPPERLTHILVGTAVALDAAYIIVIGLLVSKVSQNRKWAIWVLTLLAILPLLGVAYFVAVLARTQAAKIGVADWIFSALYSAVWLYIIFAAHSLKPDRTGALAPGWPEETGAKGGLRQMLGNLGQGLRGAFFLPVSRARIGATWGQLIALSALAIPLQFIVDFINTGPNGEFVSYGLPGVLFVLPVVLLAAWAVTARTRQPEQVLALAVALSAVSLVLNAASPLAHWLLESAPVRRSFSYAGIMDYYFDAAWFALAAGIAAVRLVGATRLQRLWVFLLAAIVIGGPLSQLFLDKTLWMKHYDRQAYERESAMRHMLEREDIFYLQPELLERELAAVKAGPKNRINLYFVGMAGYSDQDVFMKEVNYVSREFAQRYGAAAHTVELVNNPDTVGDLPIASATSLSRSLNRIGQVMNKDRDILFLYMTSHGSRNHEFSLDFGGMHFNVLNPFRLREILDASGIKRRVIVISACYSGGFIDALKDDNTLVMTAAAPDHTSFGCSNEADFTYFGKAYFRDSLPHTASFIEAFNLAKPMIAKWENADQEVHSNPQIYIGARIKDALDAFSRQQAARPDGPGTPAAGALAAEPTDRDVAMLRQHALMGEDKAQFQLGVRYLKGQGVKQDYELGVSWLQKSAAQGNTSAMCNLAWAYSTGRGAKQDYAKARYLLEQAANRSVPYAEIALGEMYKYGIDVPIDQATAVGYFRKAAVQGDGHAQVRMGDVYHQGAGVAQDDAEALKWYRKAAAHGTAEGYNALGYFMLQRREQLPEAMSYIQKAMKMAPSNPAIMDSLGWGYYITGRKAEARQLLERAYASMKNPIIAAHLGEVLWVSGDKARARKIWQAALKIHPHDPTLSATMKKFG